MLCKYVVHVLVLSHYILKLQAIDSELVHE